MVSQAALLQVLDDIKAGVVYPDFWEDRYEDLEEDQDEEEE